MASRLHGSLVLITLVDVLELGTKIITVYMLRAQRRFPEIDGTREPYSTPRAIDTQTCGTLSAKQS